MRTDSSLNLPALFVISHLRPFALLAVLAIVLGGAQLVAAQDSIAIQDPSEFNAHQQCAIQTNGNARAACLEGFLRVHPQSAAKTAFLESLIDAYEGMNDADHTLSAANRLLQTDPGNLKALFVSVFIKKGQCLKSVDQRTSRSSDPKACNEAAALARKGLSVPRPDGTSSDGWKKQTAGVYPVFHSAVALDDAFSKREYKNAVAEYTKELTLYTEDETKSVGLWDTMLLASTYARPEVDDLVKAIWFYARVSDFAPGDYKDSVEKQLDYYYRRYHGNLSGLDEIKSLAAKSVFPPESLVISPAIASGGSLEKPRRRPAAAQPQSLAIPDPALPLASTSTAGASIWPVNEKPLDASITWDSHGLTISAANSSLQQILKDVATVTGAMVEGMDTDQRVFGTYGPGRARDVLAELLRGTSYNVLMIGDQGQGTPREIVLSARNASGKTTAAANPTQNNDDDADADDQPQQPQPPPQPPVRPPFGPGGQRNPQSMRPQPGQQQPGQQPNNPQ